MLKLLSQDLYILFVPNTDRKQLQNTSEKNNCWKREVRNQRK